MSVYLEGNHVILHMHTYNEIDFQFNFGITDFLFVILFVGGRTRC